MVRWVGAHTDIPTLFQDDTTRHVNNDIVKIIIENFVSNSLSKQTISYNFVPYFFCYLKI